MTRKILLWGDRGRKKSVAGKRENQSSGTIAKKERKVVKDLFLFVPKIKLYR